MRWGIILVVQLLQCREDIVQTQSVWDTGDFTKRWVGFDDVHIRRPGREDHSLLVCRKFGIVQYAVGEIVMEYGMEEGISTLGGTIGLRSFLVSFLLLSSRDELLWVWGEGGGDRPPPSGFSWC